MSEQAGEAVDWRAVADVLAIELRHRSWIYYGNNTSQPTSVALALGLYDDACGRARSSRSEP